jgi:hypothetical protein
MTDPISLRRHKLRREMRRHLEHGGTEEQIQDAVLAFRAEMVDPWDLRDALAQYRDADLEREAA